jgi:CBS domain-containing protein
MSTTSNLTASDVMTRDVVTVHPNDTLRRAAKLMLERGVSGLPVVSADGRVVGIVSERDLIRADEMAEKSTRWWLDILAEGEAIAPDFLGAIGALNRPVTGVMRTDLTTVAEHTPLREVAERLVSENVHRVLVMENGKLVGIVARRDVVKAIAQG